MDDQQSAGKDDAQRDGVEQRNDRDDSHQKRVSFAGDVELITRWWVEVGKCSQVVAPHSRHEAGCDFPDEPDPEEPCPPIVPCHRWAHETSASGQIFEFRLWALLVEQSRGQLHVFLPPSDRGVDALVHRLTDGAYLEIQAKSRSTLMDGEVHLVIPAESVVNDEILIVAGLHVDGGLGPTLLVLPAGDFKRLANASSDQGKPIYSMEFGMRPRSDSRWLPWLVPTERVVERFGLPVEGVPGAPVEVRPEWRTAVGFLGEAEVVRRLAESENLNLFRPFASSFRPAPTTYIVVVAWLRDEARFHEECLLIPSVELLNFVNDDGSGHLSFAFDPGSAAQPQLDAYRRRLAELCHEIERLV